MPITNRKKLALVVPSLAQGGGVPAVARFVKDAALRSGRYELMLISLCMSSNESTSLQFTQPVTWRRGATTRTGEWEGLPYTHVGANWGELEFQRYKSRKVLSKLLMDCDVIQVVCGAPAWANTVTGLGKPVALQVATRTVVERRQRDRNAKGFKASWRRWMTAITNRYDDRGLQSVNAIQVENPWMLDYASSLNIGRTVDIRYAPPGINTKKFIPQPNRTLQTDPYILCVGRLSDPRKNIGLLLEAYALLTDILKNRVGLVLAGSSAPPVSFWQRADNLGLQHRVTFHHFPSQDELISLYQQAAIFALPSDEEGLGVVVLEAMAAGVPVVCTKSGGPDGIITEGVDGYLTPLDDAKTMAQRLQSLLENVEHNQHMGESARRTAINRFDEEITGAEFIDTWDNLCINNA